MLVFEHHTSTFCPVNWLVVHGSPRPSPEQTVYAYDQWGGGLRNYSRPMVGVPQRDSQTGCFMHASCHQMLGREKRTQMGRQNPSKKQCNFELQICLAMITSRNTKTDLLVFKAQDVVSCDNISYLAFFYSCFSREMDASCCIENEVIEYAGMLLVPVHPFFTCHFAAKREISICVYVYMYIYICCRVKNWSKIWGFIS